MPLTLLLGMLACGVVGSTPTQGDALGQPLQISPDSNTRLWSISGSVSNANPNAWVAVRSGNDILYVHGTNIFTFPTTYVNNTHYNVTIAGTDPSLSCSIVNNTGVISNARISNVAVSCSPRSTALFVNGFETFDRATDWSNSADDSWGNGGISNVNGYCCGMLGPQAMATDLESAHAGSGALVYSGTAVANANNQRAYLKLFDLTTLSLVGSAYLSYWIFPQSQASTFGDGVANRQSAYSAVDMTLANGTALHFLPGIVDQFGNRFTPASQGNLILDTWNFVLVDISSVAAEPLTNMSIGWANDGGIGGYRGYLDDIVIDYVPPPSSTSTSTSWEIFQSQPSWVSSVDAATGGGNMSHVVGLCCGATGPQTYVSGESAHTGRYALVYAGRGTGASPTHAYNKILDLSHSNLVLDGLSTLTYWVYPLSQAGFASVSGSLSANVALDIIFSDGSSLRESGLLDSSGNGVTPTSQSASLQLDTWNSVSVPLGALAGKVPVRIDVGWSSPGAMGGYRGLIDDISIADVAPTPSGRPPALVRIILTAVPMVLPGVNVQLKATAIYSDGSTSTLAGTATYTSDNPAVATVDANGYVTTLAVGVARIRASYGSVTSPSYTVQVLPTTYKLGGTISGLVVNTTVPLNQGVDHIAASNGSFQFPTGVAGGASYAAGLSNPPGQTCGFVGGSNAGVMPSADTMSIVVACTTNTYSLGGQVSGLTGGAHVTLSDGNDTLTSTNGSYTFPTVLPYARRYSINIVSPTGQSCVFSPTQAGSGTMPAAPVTNANIVCTPSSYQLGGTILGVANANATLVNTSNADSIYASNGTFTFDQGVLYGANYNVTFTAPAGLNCTITNGSGVMPASAVTNITLTCSIVYVFTPPAQGNYVYDTNYVTVNANVASLLPLSIVQADVNTTNFNAGAFSGVLWDSSNHYLRLSTPPANSDYVAYFPFEYASRYYTNVVDPNLGVNNVGGLGGCFNNAPLGELSNYAYHTGSNSFILAGSALSGNAYVFMQVVNLQNQNITLNSNSSIAYWVYPTGYHASGLGTSVNGNNSMYTALDILFTDGTDTRTVAALKDGNNVVFSPQAQGAGGYLVLDQWNYVKVALGALAGKTIQGIDAGWQNPNTTLGFEIYYDDVVLDATTAHPPTNYSSLDASWAPQYANLVAYWTFEGIGPVADGASLTGTAGPILTAHNSDGEGMAYINGRIGQGIYLDGVNDYLTIPTSNFPNTASMSVAAWVFGVYAGNDCPVLLSIGTFGSQGLEVGPYCGGLPGSGPFFYDSRSEYWHSTYVSSGTWNHMVFTFDGASGAATVFINGQLSTTGTYTTPLSSYLGTTPMIGAGTVCCTTPLHGIVDDLAVWNSVLNANDVALLYSRQSPSSAGTFTSRVMPSPFANQAILGMEWNTTLPFYKPLVSNANSESTASYPSLAAGGLNANMLFYWNLDETAQGSVPGGGDFVDRSGNGLSGYLTNLYNTGVFPLLGNLGRFNHGVYFNTFVDVGIWESQQFNNPQIFSAQAWFQTTSTGGLVQFSDTLRGFPSNYDRMLYVGASGLLNFALNTSNTESVVHSPWAVNDGLWHHAVGVLDASGTQSLYLDGVIAGTASGRSAQPFSGYWAAGFAQVAYWPDAGRGTFFGYLDEVAVWSRALSAGEVLQLYRRGANRQKLQLRTCTSPTCADNPNWLGPDGTTYSYFSELNNANAGAALATSPNLLLANFAPALSINANNAYVQYRSILESDDAQLACTYAGATAPCSPELLSLGLYRMNYATGQSVTLHAGALSYATLSGVVTMLGSAGCTQGITYALSPNGSSWYWYNSGWVAADGTTAQSNTVAQLTPSVLAAFVTAKGAGHAYFRAFLNSQGTSPCALTSVTFNP